jgi:hypothetical protein
MDIPDWAPPTVDSDRPSAARCWDYLLGGAHNFAVDRQVAQELIKFKPDLPELARSVRVFLRRSVQLMAHAGIEQFIDIGSGIPTVGNVHEVAQQINPRARVVYVDHDLVAVEHSRAIVSGNDLIGVVAADIREPQAIYAADELRGLIDFDQPVGLLLCAVLHFVADDADPRGCVARLVEPLVPGSYLGIQHATLDAQPEETTRMVRHWNSQSPEPMHWRTKAQISGFFDGFTVIDPGLVELTRWLPDEPAEADPQRFAAYAGVGVRPAPPS